MGMKKIKQEIENHVQKIRDEAYEEGYYHGSAYADDQFEMGVKAERERIVALFKMLSDNELEHGSGTKAKFWKEAADIVKVANELEVYNEEGEYLG